MQHRDPHNAIIFCRICVPNVYLCVQTSIHYLQLYFI